MSTKHNVILINNRSFKVKFVINSATFQYITNRGGAEKNKTITFTFENGDIRSIEAYSITKDQSSNMTQGVVPNDEFLCGFYYEKGDVILSESLPENCGKIESWVINEHA